MRMKSDKLSSSGILLDVCVLLLILLASVNIDSEVGDSSADGSSQDPLANEEAAERYSSSSFSIDPYGDDYDDNTDDEALKNQPSDDSSNTRLKKKHKALFGVDILLDSDSYIIVRKEEIIHQERFTGPIEDDETADMILRIVWCRRHGMKEELIVPFVLGWTDLIEELCQQMDNIGQQLGLNVFDSQELLWPGVVDPIRYGCSRKGHCTTDHRPEDVTALKWIHVKERAVTVWSDVSRPQKVEKSVAWEKEEKDLLWEKYDSIDDMIAAFKDMFKEVGNRKIEAASERTENDRLTDQCFNYEPDYWCKKLKGEASSSNIEKGTGETSKGEEGTEETSNSQAKAEGEASSSEGEEICYGEDQHQRKIDKCMRVKDRLTVLDVQWRGPYFGVDFDVNDTYESVTEESSSEDDSCDDDANVGNEENNSEDDS